MRKGGNKNRKESQATGGQIVEDGRSMNNLDLKRKM